MSFWPDRPVFVTGATGVVGSWLVKELLAAGASVVALVRDSDPQSELLRSGDIARITVVNGALEDYWTLERAVNGRPSVPPENLEVCLLEKARIGRKFRRLATDELNQLLAG